MSLKDIQKEVHEWTGQFEPQYWPPLHMLARLTEETGELAREINHKHGSKKKKESEPENSIANEIFDLMFTLCCIANSGGIDLEELWGKNMIEKGYRDRNRFEKKE